MLSIDSTFRFYTKFDPKDLAYYKFSLSPWFTQRREQPIHPYEEGRPFTPTVTSSKVIMISVDQKGGQGRASQNRKEEKGWQIRSVTFQWRILYQVDCR